MASLKLRHTVSADECPPSPTPIEWLRHFGFVARLGADVIFWDIELLSDGHYIGAGESFVQESNSSARRVGWLHKFSPQEDSLWENLIDAPFPLSDINRGTLAGVGELSSGSIVAAGEAIEGNQRYIWLVKVTPDGCLDTLCSVVSAAEEVVAVEKAAPAKLYPNPSRGSLTVDLPGGYGAATIAFYNLQGKMLLRQNLSGERNVINLPKGLFKPGVYIAEIISVSGQRERFKLILTQ